MSFAIIIPARGGSKRIPQKNLKKVGENSLLSIAVQKSLMMTPNVYVTTDDEEIEKEANDELVKTIQTTKGTGIVEDVQKDDDVTLDNFMDDMTNMLQETNDKEYNLFNDVG